jgi:hypothetical protein
MRKPALILFSWLILAACAGATAAEGLEPQTPDEKAFQEIKILIFDQKWEEAEAKLDGFVERFPKSPLVPQAVYYRGKCLEERGGREREALAAYRAFIQYRDQSRSLIEDAEVSIIDLALALHSRGDREAWDDLEARLSHPNRSVRQYAALRISTVKDRSLAEMAVPTLELMAEKEANQDLRDRAKIALLRIAPDRLPAERDESRHPRRARLLKFEVFEDGSRKASLSLALPWALADLVLSSIPDKDKQAMRQKGYDIPRIMRELQADEGRILEFKAEGSLIRIWIE